jgi:NAD(P)-dependent dehydrogenase (short-subunit alcohol dehydrogenase family)
MEYSLSSFSNSLNIVVMGATGGIGQSLIKRFLESEQVNSVLGLSRSEYHLDHPKYQHGHIDYQDEGSIERMVSKISIPVDIIIIATGLLHSGDDLQPEKSFTQLNSGSMLAAMQVNVVGPSIVIKHLLPKMNKHNKTVVAALSARVGSIGDNRLGGWYAYRASKAALNMMIKTFSIELRRKQKNTIIVGLHPGTVDTLLSKPFQRNVIPEKLFTADYAAQCLLGVMNQLQITDSGYCFAWDGQRIVE